MGDEGEREVVKTEREIASFYTGAKIFIPFLLTLAITGFGWYMTAQSSAEENGKKDQRLITLEITVAKLEGKTETIEGKVNGHDVSLGRIEVQLTNVEKVSNETYNMLRDYTSNN